MYKNYVFDLYGTLVDINTNERKMSLWTKMTELYSFYGAKYTPKEMKKEFERICLEEENKIKKFDYPEMKIEKTFKKLFENDGKKVIISPYTKYLKKYIEEITNEKINETNKPRDLLQQISSKIIKGDLNKVNFFIDRQIEDIEIYSYFTDIILIPDVRFPKEIEIIKEKFNKVVSIKVNRKDYISILTKEQLIDETETALDNYHNFNFEITNDKNTDLEIEAKKIIEKINEGSEY